VLAENREDIVPIRLADAQKWPRRNVAPQLRVLCGGAAELRMAP
jgi:hypothetical protein